MIRRTAVEVAIRRVHPPRSSVRRRVVSSARSPAQSMNDTPDMSRKILALRCAD
jgi:hypothetical protein